MSNSAAAAFDTDRDRQIAENTAFLNKIADEVKQTAPFGTDFENRHWIETNREKILKTRLLIDLLK